MSPDAAIALSLLSLHPLPIQTIPTASSAQYSVFTAALQQEAALLFASDAWSAPQAWHHDLVQTRALAPHAVTHTLSSFHVPPAGHEPHEKKRGFFNRVSSAAGVGSSDPHAGISWHCRETIVKPETGYGYQVFWDTLAERHCEQEVEYVSTLSKVIEIGDKGCFLKLYELPFPTTNRSFLSHVSVLIPPPTPASSVGSDPLRSFLIFALPVLDPSTTADKGYVRGSYVAVEQVCEIEGTDGARELHWRCASMSSPGGNIPTRLAESHMPSSLASHVPTFFTWLQSKYGGAGAHVPHTPHPSLVKRLSLKGPLSRRRNSRDPVDDVVQGTVLA